MLRIPALDSPLLKTLSGQTIDSATDLADAAGWTLSAGIPGGEEQGRLVPRSLPHSRARGRSNAAAAATVRSRCGDRVFRHSDAFPMRWVRRSSSSKARDRGSSRSNTGKAIAGLDMSNASKALAPVYATIERVVAELPKDCAADRLLRRAVDGRDLHGRGRRQQEQAAARLFAYRDRASFQRLIDLLVESLGRLSGEPGQGRRQCAADLRQLGGKPARGRVRPLVHRADQAHRRAGEGRGAGDAGDRLPARRGPARRALCQGDRRRRRGLRHEHAARLDQGEFASAWCRCRAISIRCCSSPADRSSTPACARSWRRLGKAPSSSISAMASCPRRPSRMSRDCWTW